MCVCASATWLVDDSAACAQAAQQVRRRRLNIDRKPNANTSFRSWLASYGGAAVAPQECGSRHSRQSLGDVAERCIVMLESEVTQRPSMIALQFDCRLRRLTASSRWRLSNGSGETGRALITAENGPPTWVREAHCADVAQEHFRRGGRHESKPRRQGGMWRGRSGVLAQCCTVFGSGAFALLCPPHIRTTLALHEHAPRTKLSGGLMLSCAKASATTPSIARAF